MINLDKFYTGNYAIYSKGLDRFILLDKYDLTNTFHTAEILSSKIALTVYIISDPIFTNENCINFSIFNKTGEKVGYSPAVISKQTPLLRFIENSNIKELGTPEDYKSNTQSIDTLIEYANFVRNYVYAISLTEKIYNFDTNFNLINTLIPNSWVQDISYSADRSKLPEGIFKEIKSVLYLSSSIEEAAASIDNLWANNSTDQTWLRDGFYKILQQQAPVSSNQNSSGLISGYLV